MYYVHEQNLCGFKYQVKQFVITGATQNAVSLILHGHKNLFHNKKTLKINCISNVIVIFSMLISRK